LTFVEDYYGLTFARQEIGRRHAGDSSANDANVGIDILIKRRY
jgi:hypothetical protein